MYYYGPTYPYVYTFPVSPPLYHGTWNLDYSMVGLSKVGVHLFKLKVRKCLLFVCTIGTLYFGGVDGLASWCPYQCAALLFESERTARTYSGSIFVSRAFQILTVGCCSCTGTPRDVSPLQTDVALGQDRDYS
jgi:hypothetical protein